MTAAAARRLFENATCPRCGSPLQVVTDGKVGDRSVPFVACTGCEWCEAAPWIGKTRRTT